MSARLDAATYWMSSTDGKSVAVSYEIRVAWPQVWNDETEKYDDRPDPVVVSFADKEAAEFGYGQAVYDHSIGEGSDGANRPTFHRVNVLTWEGGQPPPAFWVGDKSYAVVESESAARVVASTPWWGDSDYLTISKGEDWSLTTTRRKGADRRAWGKWWGFRS
jgi:hypothetical protein